MQTRRHLTPILDPNQASHRGTLSVSVVVCCHNSAERLPDTLRHLQAQRFDADLQWEVIVVDNRSNDQTAAVAARCWSQDPVVPLNVVHADKLGLRHARDKGVAAARYEIISFVDDDNWVSPTWVSQVSRIFSEHGDIGACGGCTYAALTHPAPSWFSEYAACFAVGPQYPHTGDITWREGHLWGAGLSIRRQAWADLFANGFEPQLTGRRGRELTSGEDYELCYALRLAGWMLRYDESLTLQHAIPQERMCLDYLARLWEGFGVQSVGFDPYRRYTSDTITPRTVFGQAWLFQLLRELYIAAWRDRSIWSAAYPLQTQASLGKKLNWRWHRGRMLALLRARSRYDRQIHDLPLAKWVRISREDARNLSREQK